jgi:NhaA family Na+:H+ antiporter
LDARRAIPSLPSALLRPFQLFFRLEAASALVLLGAALGAFAWANAAPASYQAVVGARVAGVPLATLVNDGLMTLFFLVVGLEIKRELTHGELATPAQAALPAIAALGGMLVPALVFIAVVPPGPARAGWAIPMATDIAFTLGCLTLLGDRVPRGLSVFVTALAIFDDIGGVLVIAVFYGAGLHGPWLAAAAAIGAATWALGRRGVDRILPYLVAGAALWLTLHAGGIHATLAGVALGLLIPARAGTAGEAPCDRLERRLHPLVAFGVMPLFALANAGVDLGGQGLAALAAPVALATALGLFAGKQLGVFATTAAAVRLGFAPAPGAASGAKLYGASVLTGIGFTVALFIATLAYRDAPARLAEAKLGILAGSALAGLIGSAVLRATRRGA